MRVLTPDAVSALVSAAVAEAVAPLRENVAALTATVSDLRSSVRTLDNRVKELEVFAARQKNSGRWRGTHPDLSYEVVMFANRDDPTLPPHNLPRIHNLKDIANLTSIELDAYLDGYLPNRDRESTLAPEYGPPEIDWRDLMRNTLKRMIGVDYYPAWFADAMAAALAPLSEKLDSLETSVRKLEISVNKLERDVKDLHTTFHKFGNELFGVPITQPFVKRSRKTRTPGRKLYKGKRGRPLPIRCPQPSASA